MRRLTSYIIVAFFLILSSAAKAQFLMDMVDTSHEMGKSMLAMYYKYNYLRISGYIQPQFQYIQTKGAATYAGPNFQPNSNNRFILRRGRVRFDYARFNKNDKLSAQFVFQFDGTERGVNIRDFWGRVFENKFEVLGFTMGMFARPFGYEVNLSSQDRESPERGRMSQILMRTERDLGAMASFEPRGKSHKLKWLKVDAGVFNGQGLTGTAEYDSYKDFITRASFKPVAINNSLRMSGGLSYLNGGFIQNTKYVYEMGKPNGAPGFIVDSSESNLGEKAPRIYYGADAQWELRHHNSVTTLRAEYWWGTQTGTDETTETPGVIENQPYYVRKFNGAFFYLLHAFGKNQVGVKFDWYDPNTKVKGDDISKSHDNMNPADIRYNTLGVGYLNYINENLKLVLWYDFVMNEKTQLEGYTEDIKDNVLTFRLQFRF
ncbi:porin [Flavihumibacter solisilvae]|nr:porin [Flavihumibacter solisilvae]